MVSPVERDGRAGPLEEGGHGRLDAIDLSALELLLTSGGVGVRSAEDHETRSLGWVDRVFAIGIVAAGVGLLRLSLLGAPCQELPHETAVFEGVLDGVAVVQAWPLEHFLEVVG